MFVIRSLVGSPFWGDDLWSSQVPMVLHKNRFSVWSVILEQIKSWMKFTGRFHPVFIVESNWVHIIFSGRSSYKLYQLFVTLLNVSLFVVLVGRLSKQRFVGIVAGLLLATTLQIRLYSDAILSFNVHVPTFSVRAAALALMLAALLAAHRFFETEKRRWIVVAAVLWMSASMLYEVAVLLALLFVLVAIAASATPRAKRQALMAIGVPLVVYVAFVGFLRVTAATQSERYPALADNAAVQQSESEYQTSLDPARLTKTFLIQSIGALPLSQSTIRVPPHRLGIWPALRSLGAVDLLLAIGNGALMVFALRRLRPPPRRVVTVLAGAGLLLWIVPALLVAQAARWQNDLELGAPFMSVYLGFFGVALVMTACVLGLVRLNSRWSGTAAVRRSWVMCIAVATLAALAVQVTAENNGREVATISSVRQSWELFGSGVARGVFTDVPNGATVLGTGSDSQSPWVNACAIAWQGGPDVNLIRSAAPFPGCGAPKADLGGGEPTFVLWTNGTAPGALTATVVVARIDLVRSTAGDAASVASHDLDVYLQGDGTEPLSVQNVVLGGSWTDDAGVTVPVDRQIPSSEVTTVSQGPGWGLLRVHPTEGLYLPAIGARLCTQPC